MNELKRLHSPDDFRELVTQIDSDRERAADTRSIRICYGGGCLASGACELRDALQTAAERAEIDLTIRPSGCMGPCAAGPVISVDPERVFYEGVRPEDAAEIVEKHLVGGTPLTRLLHRNRADGEIAAVEDDVDFFEAQTRVVLKNCGSVDPEEIASALGAGAYVGLVTALTESTPETVVETMLEAGLRGRGGAGFPTGIKWQAAAQAPGPEKYVLCNADEGDPGAFMDRSVLEGDPHTLIEGMALAAYAVGAQRGYVYVRAEYPLAVERLERAIEQARTMGLLGEGILGTEFSFDLDIRMGSGAFVCGEETALIHSIEGKRGEPRPRPPFPAQSGLWGKPTLLNNVETYANVPPIIRNGAQWFRGIGTADSPGTKVFALAGSVVNTGLVEVPIGTPLGELIYDIGGGIRNGKEFKAAQIGGPSGGCIPREFLNVPLDYAELNKLGAIMGSGGLIVMDEDACMVDVARFFLEFVQEESCGKCAPCRVGTKRMLEILERICDGHGEDGDIEQLEQLGEHIRDTALCGLGQTAPNPVLSTIRHFRHEYEEHIRDHHCAAGVCPGLVRAPCQSGCPAGVDIPGFVSLVGEKRYAEALRRHRNRNPFAAVCARVCFHTCEDKCRRASMDAPVSIRAVKRFMADQEVTLQLPEVRESEDNARRKVAIVGAGPAGLSCAYFLARRGYRPVVYEAGPRPGGMLVQTIPEYRLPRETLALEIRMIEQMGVEIRTGRALGTDFTLSDLRGEGYEAVYLAVGAPECLGMGIPGEDAKNVVHAIDFLKQYNIRGSVPVGKNVLVIGGGNAAIDAARTAVRLGAHAKVIYRRTREQMPAYAEEIDQALLEGVGLDTLTQPMEIVTDENGAATGVRCSTMTLGEFDRSGRRRPRAADDEEFFEEADQVIVAIGQKLDVPHITRDVELEPNAAGFVHADPTTAATAVEWLFAGGDAASGPSSVIRAIAAGERGAYGIDLHLTGADHAFWREPQPIDTAYDPSADPAPYAREPLPTIPAERRRRTFAEVEQPWCEAVALRQAKRCLRCDYGKAIAGNGYGNGKEEINA
ncbi:MAG: FAD-dependent oxidoreductase [Spirochaeta sp.]|jgi:NADH-quinone oxidoreductase subunit F|nr:FAD-dependent oxidoreductase [Spirochaeta sp.]